MCVDCSAFANHSGLCPNCRRDSIAAGLQKIKSIKLVNIWVVVILSIFVLAGTAATYFLFFPNPLIFAACAAVPVFFIYLAVRLKKLRASEQGLNANLAQITQTLLKALPHTGIINPLNPYQDLDACKPADITKHWQCKCGAQNSGSLAYCAECNAINPAAGNQLTFIEPLPEEIPVYKAHSDEEQSEVVPAAETSEVPNAEEEKISCEINEPNFADIDELQIAANRLITEDDIFEGQITFKEVLEEILRELSQPVKKPMRAAAGEYHRAEQPSVRRPARPAPKAKAPEKSEPVPAASKPAAKPAEKTAAAAKPPEKPVTPAAAPKPLPPPQVSEEEKKIEKERAAIRKELGKLREQINELYKKNRP